MTRITVEIDDGALRSVVGRMALAVERFPRREMRRYIEQARDQARTYPPELPGQRYRRTGTYFRSFRVTSVGRGYRLASNAVQRGRRYTRYVGGLADGSGQARIHVGRWLRIRDAVERAQQAIVQRAREMFADILRSSGGGL